MGVLIEPRLVVIDGDPNNTPHARRVDVARRVLRHLHVTPQELMED